MAYKQLGNSSFIFDDETNKICGIKQPDNTIDFFTFVDDSSGVPVDGVKATITSDMTNANADVYLTAAEHGVQGNLISIVYVDPAANSQSLAVTVNGLAISVSLATNGSGTITSTAAQVAAAINADDFASALVAATYEGTGAGVTNAKTVAKLTGGVTCTAGAIGTIRANSDATQQYIKTGAQTWSPIMLLKQETIKTETGSLAATSMAGHIINNYGQTADAVITLAAAAKGLHFTVILGTTVAKYYRLDPASGDSIYLDGATTGDGKYVGIASASAGAAIEFTAFQAGANSYDWAAKTIAGTWVAESA